MSGININLPATFEQEVVFKECRHNHAASLGRMAFDGCREFLKPSDVDGGAKEAMICVACGCHRNFHRKDTVYNPILTAATASPTHHHHHQPDFQAGGPSSNTRVVQLINHGTTTMHAPPSAAAGNTNNAEGQATAEPPPGRKKRTMFTAEQRNRMVRFAERLGWRPQRADKEAVQDFCMDMGISRRMFLVWLSNNRRRVAQPNTAASTA